MFALQPGEAGCLLKQYRRYFSDVKAVLVISPHWMTSGLSLTAADELETLHDFYGFPSPLYNLVYNAPGSQQVAGDIYKHLSDAGYQVTLDSHRGRDHGAWVPMLHLLPEEKLPVLQLSFDRTMDAAALLQLGKALKGLRAEGIVIIASGSLTHNLSEVKAEEAAAEAYAQRFESWVRNRVQIRDFTALAAPEQADYQRAHPTTEHYLPLLVALGATNDEDRLDILAGGILHGVISMESYGWH
jgi:4,5-DOPA dioxygenase extradiol